jgi:hypothetical protein
VLKEKRRSLQIAVFQFYMHELSAILPIFAPIIVQAINEIQ